MVTDSLAMLLQLGGTPASGVHLQPAADEAAIRQMQAAARRDLGEPVPDEYTALLRVTNGVQVNCAYFKSAGIWSRKTWTCHARRSSSWAPRATWPSSCSTAGTGGSTR